jgi:hypothetical protein
MSLRISLTIVAVILLGAVSRASGPSVDVTPLLQIVTDKSARVAEWESAARIQMLLTIAGIAFGGLITVLQPWGSRTWSKVVVGLLGVAAAMVAALSSKSPVNYATYERSVLQANAKISMLKDDISYLRSTSDPGDQEALQKEFQNTVKDINQIYLKLSDNDKGVAFLPQRIDVVYAQSAPSALSKAPPWVTSLPANSTDWYFRGASDGRSLSEASAKSLQDALDQCARLLLSQGNAVPLETAKQYAKTSTGVADTFFTYDSRAGIYRYYTLVRLDKSLARSGVVAALSVSAIPGNDAKPKCSSMRVGHRELAAFDVGEKPIYVYLVGQSPHPGKADTADLVVLTRPKTWTMQLDALPSHKPDGTPPIKRKVTAKMFDALRQADPQGYIERKLENGRSFAAAVDGENFSIRVETHCMGRFANVTVCPLPDANLR